MSSFTKFRERLLEKAKDANKRAVTYVAIGDSVTQGCMEVDVYEYTDIYHQVFRRAVEQQFPGTVINVINSGVGGDTIEASRPRWERDVLLYKPDLVTICFGHNDAHHGREGVADFIKGISDLLDRIQAETEAEVLLITPCMMMKEVNTRISEKHQVHIPAFVKLAEEEILGLYVSALRQLAEERNLPCLDVYAIWEQMEQEGQDIHALLSNGINHPVAAFHRRWGQFMTDKVIGEARSL